ncbi:MAG: cupin domain-containing protein [Acidobacteriota bacterium]|nr:cupin domain-containing protein [Acidobacteriota bacterium]
MSEIRLSLLQSAEMVIPCEELEPAFDFFTEVLGFRVNAVFPADAPVIAEIQGYGLRLRLQAGASGSPGTIRLLCKRPDEVAAGERVLTAPNGTRIELEDADPAQALPPVNQSLIIAKIDDNASWHQGRAGMMYRDLIPGRQGGRFIASHIRIPDGGPVPDYVHFHKVYFQMIYVYKGWVRVVYEDQGPPFVMRAGDCVLQPPRIRHRVLESSPDLEVIEVGCPAEHETLADHQITLPTISLNPNRDFSGQRFVLYRAEEAQRQPWIMDGWEALDTGIAAATDGVAGARSVRPVGEPSKQYRAHDGEFLFFFVLTGGMNLHLEKGETQQMTAGDCCVLPAGLSFALTPRSTDLELLEISLPG